MTAAELIDLAIKMRDAQKRYFSHRDNLIACKKLEQQFDSAARDFQKEDKLL